LPCARRALGSLPEPLWSAERAEPLLQVVGVPNGTMSDEFGMANTVKAVRRPSKVPKYIASGFQHSAAL
jgi:hypothetical protein